MRYGSVCSGIEAATVAWHSLGWKPSFFSEIEPFPCAVLKHHYPSVPNFGDMTKYKGWPHADIDVLVGGTPCQSFSVAGLRQGLADPRGNLMLTFGAIADKYRPKWLVWENVPGVLSSNAGRDFGTFLGMLGELGYGFAYRTLDAQYVRTHEFPRAVPQRRRRVFVVGYLGDWRRAAAVLFEWESLSGHPAPSRETRTSIATGSSQCFEYGHFTRFAETGLSSTLTKKGLSGSEGGNGAEALIATTIFGDDVCGTLIKSDEAAVSTTQDGKVICVTTPNCNNEQPIAFPWQSALDPIGKPDNICGTLIKNQKMAVATQMQVRRLTPIECEFLQGFPANYTNIPWRNKDESPDGPRYKSLGNSMAVPVMQWIGQRIQMIEDMDGEA